MDPNLEYWLIEQDIPAASQNPDPSGGQVPTSQPGYAGNPMNQPQNQQNVADGPPTEDDDEDNEEDENLSPDLEDKEEGEYENFDAWKKDFIKESIKGEPNAMVELLLKIRDGNLEADQRKFVEDNLQISFLRQNSNILISSKEIRNKIKTNLDKLHPASYIVDLLVEQVQKYVLIREPFYKLTGLLGAKGDYHRKYVASLLGALQTGAGGKLEDLVFEDKDYSIRISTRFNSRFGDINIGYWSLLEDDPEKYLKKAEMLRLENGSPEEKDVLKKRVVLESICNLLKTRAFLINVIAEDGTLHFLGWDIGNSLKNAYRDGRIIVKSRISENSEAIIDDDGNIMSSLDWCLCYVQETDDLDEDGKVAKEEIPFIERRDGMLFLVADINIIKDASVVLDGMNLKQIPWQGTPDDLKKIYRCIPSAPEVLLRQC